jgi:hypothetical protein
MILVEYSLELWSCRLSIQGFRRYLGQNPLQMLANIAGLDVARTYKIWQSSILPAERHIQNSLKCEQSTKEDLLLFQRPEPC